MRIQDAQMQPREANVFKGVLESTIRSLLEQLNSSGFASRQQKVRILELEKEVGSLNINLRLRVDTLRGLQRDYEASTRRVSS